MWHSNQKTKRMQESVGLTGVSLTAYLYGPVEGGALTQCARAHAQ